MEKEAEVVLVLSDWDSQSDMSEGDSDESGTRAPEVIDLTWSDTSVGSDDFESKKLKSLHVQIPVTTSRARSLGKYSVRKSPPSYG